MTVPSGSAVRRDIPKPSEPEETVWASDAIADMLRAMDIPYVLLNPAPAFAACTTASSTTWAMKSRR
jgi:hypothetical protein